ncbi:uncharacterized protein O3C94_021391 isoform 1-T1 [Discoglossus pictus]
MSNCVVKGCKSTTRRRKSNPNVSLHSFPKCPERIKLWLTQTGQHFENIDAFVQRIVDTNKNSTYRMCSMHFSPDSYYSRGVSKLLKPDAVPSIFSRMEDGMESNVKLEELPTTSYAGTSTISADRRFYPIASSFQTHPGVTRPDKMHFSQQPRRVFMGYIQDPPFRDASTNTPLSITEDKTKSPGRILGIRSVKTQTSVHFGKRSARTSTNDMFRKKDASMWTGLENEDDFNISISFDCSTSTDDLLENDEQSEHPVDIKTESFPLQSYSLCRRSYSKRLKTEPMSERCRTVYDDNPNNVSGVESGMESVMLGKDILTNDLNYNPETTENINELCFLGDPSEEDVVKERKFVVFESCIDELLSKLTCSYNDECHANIIKKEKKINGTLLTVYGTCHNGHTMKLWQSQPTVRQVPVGNVLSSAALLFSGCHYADVQDMFNFLGVPFISESTYSMYEKKIIFPTIDRHWKRDRQSTIQSLKGKPLSLAGDGQSYSPGVNTKCSTFTLLDDKTKKIVDFHTIQATESASIGSMELKAFRRCVNNVLNEGLQVHIISTERNVGIKRIMRDEYNHIAHQFDLRHYCENFRKKLIARSKKKTFKTITPWIPEIVNHLWASSCTSKGNIHLMEENWNSILYHVTNQHLWDDGILVTACVHPPLTTDEEKKRPWIPDTTPAFNELQELVSSKQIQKDIQYLAESCHTEDIDVFRNLLLKYLPKHTHFKIDAIKARTKLAVLAHNASVTQPQVTTSPLGRVGYNPCFTKTKREWPERMNCRPIKFDHVFSMMTDVIRIAS